MRGGLPRAFLFCYYARRGNGFNQCALRSTSLLITGSGVQAPRGLTNKNRDFLQMVARRYAGSGARRDGRTVANADPYASANVDAAVFSLWVQSIAGRFYLARYAASLTP